jgi:simple sugar transport system permease protein/ribose transport system permease protein
LGIILIAIALVAIFAATSGGRWANFYNIASILQVTATLGLMALGVSLVIGTREIDISVGSTFGMGALVYLWLANNADPLVGLIATLGAGLLIGLLNGWLVVWAKTPSLIITLGTLMIFRGIAIALTGGFSFSVPYAERGHPVYQVLGGGELFGLNTAVPWMVCVLVALSIFLFATPGGNRLLAVGGSAESAHSRGVHVDRVKITAFAVCGLLAALGGALEAGKLGFADGSMGRLMELQAIAACVLGGCALAGGRVSLVGAVLGAFVLSSIQSYLVVMGVRPQWFILLLGLIVVFAAFGDKALRVWALKRR